MNIKIFADTANFEDIIKLSENPLVRGYTTNPSLMKKYGVKNYVDFALELLKRIPDKKFSFEVISDDFEEMKKQAIKISSWGDNVYVKIPITNTKGESSLFLIQYLSEHGVKINVTAITTLNQILRSSETLKNIMPSIISVFAGRISDTGTNAIPIMEEGVEIIRRFALQELLWASTREVYNIIEAQNCGCNIITVTPEILSKMNLIGKNLDQYSLETVQMFYNDAINSGYTL